MARLACEAKAGFYPISPVAVEGILKHVYLADKSREHTIIDPCCGQGKAIQQLALGLGVPEEFVYCVELDKQRAQDTRDLMPKANVLGPASFFSTHISGYSFSLAYCNPPFSSELGGGRREEQSFVTRCTHLLGDKGILVLVMPLSQFVGNRNFVQYVDSFYEDVQAYRLPDGHGPYGEMCLFARKRKIEIPIDILHQRGDLHQRGWQWCYGMRCEDLPPLSDVQPVYWRDRQASYDRESFVRLWPIEKGWRPGTFKKIQFTDEELVEAVQTSPLAKHLTVVQPREIPRPPLPLDKGHLGLILASGILDGVVESPFGPHVVRGSSTKVEYYNKEASDSTEDPETGAVTTRDVYSQRMVTVIRCVTGDGTLHTYSNAPKEEDKEDGQ
jgi:predicted RNA methylase